ncbi:translation initiation factor IF-2-like [Apus apus]|uniref:translation initiation factor IF-2-like n=1 Tax=Apus apus TaxID=8895 RepID=UPI0021F8A0EE|nr:translation initiation factor IF-2-like [Apus apus]
MVSPRRPGEPPPAPRWRPPPTGASPASSSSSSPPPRSASLKAISAGASARRPRLRRVPGGGSQQPRSRRGGASPSGRYGGRDGRRSPPGSRSVSLRRRSPGQGSSSGRAGSGSSRSPGGTAEESRRRGREPAAGERRWAGAGGPRFAAGAMLLGGLRCGGEPRDGAAVRALPEPSPPAELGGQPAAVGRGRRQLRRCGQAPGGHGPPRSQPPRSARGGAASRSLLAHTRRAPVAGRKRPPGAAASWFPPPDKLRQVSGGLRGAPPAAPLPLLRRPPGLSGFSWPTTRRGGGAGGSGGGRREKEEAEVGQRHRACAPRPARDPLPASPRPSRVRRCPAPGGGGCRPRVPVRSVGVPAGGRRSGRRGAEPGASERVPPPRGPVAPRKVRSIPAPHAALPPPPFFPAGRPSVRVNLLALFVLRRVGFDLPLWYVEVSTPINH